MSLFGIDLVPVRRVARILDRPYGESFLDRLFSESEREWLVGLGEAERILEVASGYAIKEAVIKASAGMLALDFLREISIRRGTRGPMSTARKALWGECVFMVSACHDAESVYAVASCVETVPPLPSSISPERSQ